MEKTRHILAINVGSTSTKVAFYRDSERLVQESIAYSATDLARCASLKEQLPLREEGLRKFIEKNARPNRTRTRGARCCDRPWTSKKTSPTSCSISAKSSDAGPSFRSVD